MAYLGIFYSPAANLRPEFQTKRVHAAAAYVLPIRLEQTVSAKQLQAALIPQDKAENSQPFVCAAGHACEGLNSGHAHMYDQAMRYMFNHR